MCGVVALLAPLAATQRQALTSELCALLGHRGPDGQGLWSGADEGPCGVTLGHRRLAILDLSPAAAQPMHRGPLSISYNGEFYNYLEKREELAARGHRFVSRSDTEVLLALVEDRGVSAALSQVNGMFAFALWDPRTRSLYLARDRFGEKPLYYLLDSERGYCIVASEIKAVLHAARKLELPVAVHREVLACYLADADYEVGDATFFSTVKRVRPGELVRIDVRPDGRLARSAELYYELSPERCSPGQDQGRRADQHFVELLTDSLRLRLRSDVPLGACLSGGLDSSALTCLTQSLLAPTGARLQTFSAVHQPGDPCDESRYIDAVVEHTGVQSARTDPQTLLDAAGGPDAFAAFLRHHDEPIGGASVFAQHAVYRLAAASGVRVVLSGQGADEALTGYAGALPLLRADLLRQGRWPGRHGLGQALRLALRQELPDILQGAWLALRWRRAFARTPYFDLSALAPLPAQPTPPRHLLAFAQRSLLHGYLYSLLCGSSLGTILRYEDRNSMAASIESRAPFLDHRVVEHCLSRPAGELVEDGRTKALLRRTIGPRLPALVRERRDKIGFAAPEARWLLGPLRELVQDVLHSTEMTQRGLYDCAALQRDYAAARRGAALDSYALWKAINVELWLRFKVIAR